MTKEVPPGSINNALPVGIAFPASRPRFVCPFHIDASVITNVETNPVYLVSTSAKTFNLVASRKCRMTAIPCLSNAYLATTLPPEAHFRTSGYSQCTENVRVKTRTFWTGREASCSRCHKQQSPARIIQKHLVCSSFSFRFEIGEPFQHFTQRVRIFAITRLIAR